MQLIIYDHSLRNNLQIKQIGMKSKAPISDFRTSLYCDIRISVYFLTKYSFTINICISAKTEEKRHQLHHIVELKSSLK